MIKEVKALFWASMVALLLLTACNSLSEASAAAPAQVAISSDDEAAPVSILADIAQETAAEDSIGTADGVAENDEAAAAVMAGGAAALDDAEEYVLDSTGATQIVLAGDAIAVEGDAVQVDGLIATITAAGTYRFSGSLEEGQIIVDTEDEDVVQIILDGVHISNTTSAPIYIAGAAETVIMLAEDSENSVTDGATYVFEDPEEDEPNAAVFSKDDLTILGAGSLTVAANYNDGIASKDGLIIAGGDITVNAVDDGIRGKEYLLVQDGTLTVMAQGDGLKSDEDEDASLGYIAIEDSVINITSGGDAIQAERDVYITGGDFTLTSGGGSNATILDDTSAKGIKAGVNATINGGTFIVDSADDAIHSNDGMVINGGSFLVATGDDGFHADATLEFNGGVVRVTDSYEGVESAMITINDGELNIVSSDDGINVAGGNDGSGFGAPGGGPGGRGRPLGGSNSGPGQVAFAEYTGDYYLFINGGYVVVDAGGDGLDVNGAIEMTDGIVIVNGPTDQMNGALDHDGPFTISGGYFAAAGSAGMAQTAGAVSTQNALLLNLNGTLPGGTIIHIEDSSGSSLLTFAPTKAYQSIAFSSPALVSGMTYTVFYGGSDSGTFEAGLYLGGDYSGGTEYTSFIASEGVTVIGSVGRW